MAESIIHRLTWVFPLPALALLLLAGAIAPTPLQADDLCTVTSGRSCSDNGCAKTGKHCVYCCADLDCNCVAKKGTGGGSMTAFDPSSTSSFSFSSSVLTNLTYSEEFTYAGVLLAPQMTSFTTTIALSATVDPNILAARFTSYLFEYTPFSLGTGASIRYQQMTGPVSEQTGQFNLTTNALTLQTPVLWIDTAGVSRFGDGVAYQIQFTPSGSQFDVAFTAEGYASAATCVPEPATGGLLLLGGLIVIAARRRR